MLTVSIRGVRGVTARADPRAQGRWTLVRFSRSTLEIRAQVRISRELRWTFCYRDQARQIAAGGSETPQDLAPLLLAGVRSEIADPGVSLPRGADPSWDLRTGGILWAHLRWETPRTWQGGATVAATPIGGSGHAALPVRFPPGRSFWCNLGAGRWFCELWLGRAAATWRLEGALRMLTGNAPPGGRVTWILGVRRSLTF
jgi:hypothetical protein